MTTIARLTGKASFSLLARFFLAAVVILAPVLGLAWAGAFVPGPAMLGALGLHGVAALGMWGLRGRIGALDGSLKLDGRALSQAMKAASRVRWVQLAGIILLVVGLAGTGQGSASSDLSLSAPLLFVVCVALGYNLGALLAVALSLLAQARLIGEVRGLARSSASSTGPLPASHYPRHEPDS